MKTRFLRASLLGSVLLFVCAGHAEEFALVVRGEVKSQLKLSLSDLKGLTNSTVTVAERNASNVKYEGVFLHYILSRCGCPLG
jgi:hypothetical protein